MCVVCSAHTCTDVPLSRAEMFDFYRLSWACSNLQSCQDGHHLFTQLSKSQETAERAEMYDDDEGVMFRWLLWGRNEGEK